MSRTRNPIRPIVWGLKLTLTPGVDDDLIALRDRLAPGTQAVSIKHLIRSGGLTTQTYDPLSVKASNDVDVELALSDLIG